MKLIFVFIFMYSILLLVSFTYPPSRLNSNKQADAKVRQHEPVSNNFFSPTRPASHASTHYSSMSSASSSGPSGRNLSVSTSRMIRAHRDRSPTERFPTDRSPTGRNRSPTSPTESRQSQISPRERRAQRNRSPTRYDPNKKYFMNERFSKNKSITRFFYCQLFLFLSCFKR